MELKNINTKNLYYASNKLSTYANEIYAEMKTAHKLMCEGFITEAQYAAIKEDREKKIAPYENGADLLTRFANAVNAQIAMETSGDIMSEFMAANAEPVDSFDLEDVNVAVSRATGLDDPMPC